MKIELSLKIAITAGVFCSATCMAMDLVKLTPTPKELPGGVSLAVLAGIDARFAPKWLKRNPQSVKTTEDRQAALKDFQPEKLDLANLRNLVVFNFAVEAETGSGSIGVGAAELPDSDAVSRWRSIIESSMTHFPLQKVHFVANGRVLIWFIFFEGDGAQCEALEKVMTKKLEVLVASEATNP